MVLDRSRRAAILDAHGVEPRDSPLQLVAALEKLKRENAELRDEVQRLEIYRAMAYRDDLTGLYNRRYFEERLRQEFCRAQRFQWPFSVVVIDVDDFKQINDRHGHAIGDEVLVFVAKFLARNLRGIDLACRIGGDEFSLILPYTNRAGTCVLVDRLRNAMTIAGEKRVVTIHLSIGIASYPVDGVSPSELVARADDDMYRQKRHKAPAASGPRAIPETKEHLALASIGAAPLGSMKR